jgi:hypothetical protein
LGHQILLPRTIANSDTFSSLLNLFREQSNLGHPFSPEEKYSGKTLYPHSEAQAPERS